jgi:hypothetical protein
MDADLLAQTALILQERLTLAGIEGVVEQDGAELRIRTNASSDQLVRLMTHVGWVELVDFSDLNTAYIPSVGSCLLTTAQQTAYAEQDICAVSELAPLEHPNGGPFETLLAATDFAAVQLSEPLLGQSRWTLSGHVTPAAQPLLADLTEARQGQQLGLLLDGELLSAPTIATPITDGRFLIELDAEWSAAQAQDLQVVLATAPLPLALTLTGSKAFPAGDADYQRPQ